MRAKLCGWYLIPSFIFAPAKRSRAKNSPSPGILSYRCFNSITLEGYFCRVFFFLLCCLPCFPSVFTFFRLVLAIPTTNEKWQLKFWTGKAVKTTFFVCKSQAQPGSQSASENAKNAVVPTISTYVWHDGHFLPPHYARSLSSLLHSNCKRIHTRE